MSTNTTEFLKLVRVQDRRIHGHHCMRCSGASTAEQEPNQGTVTSLTIEQILNPRVEVDGVGLVFNFLTCVRGTCQCVCVPHTVTRIAPDALLTQVIFLR
jgi:hypothetical protein